MDEEVLVIERTKLFGKKDENAFTGFKTAQEFKINEEAMKSAHFRLRKTTSPTQELPAEEDAKYKQIIPYMIVTHKNKIFCCQRTPKGTENRLHNKYSIGMGGHLNQIDVKEKTNLIEEGMKRELSEEIDYHGTPKTKILGYINDDSGEVEKVHFAIVYEIQLVDEYAATKEAKLINSRLMTLEEIEKIEDSLENWSKIVYKYLKTHKQN